MVLKKIICVPSVIPDGGTCAVYNKGFESIVFNQEPYNLGYYMSQELENEVWYHGALPIEDIAALVANKGDFLIRQLEPEGGRGPMPCLTVRLESQMKDYPIHLVQMGKVRMFTIDGVNKATTVAGIVQKHYQEKISLQDQGMLLKPIPKQPWELSKDKINLKTKLGEGAFGEVWKGTLRQSSTKTVEAAIKVVSDAICSIYQGSYRDLACRNCLIDTQKNIVKISDFGLSKQADSYKIQPNERIPTKWQAPEVVATHIYTRECDVYSYGILVWEIFNNAKMPFEEYDNKTVRARISDPRFRPPLSDDLPDEIRVIVTACWAAQANNRPRMKDVAWILKRFQKHRLVNFSLALYCYR
ncbi:protein tyrosine kinase [Necator americanus]|uniref:Protein tyrosine kinase n=1 Tax=Necator americanus TaxID=51031 RepID=W2SR76_NECAM|nr:protein tyrosine kinase [Necator americanus]ETN72135.1 protein tyrosine kinase [Necator americanus]